MATSRNILRRFLYNVDKFYERLDTLSHLERAVASERFIKLKGEIEALEIKVEKGMAKTGELNRMIKKLQSYKNQRLTELIDVYSPTLDKVVPYKTLLKWNRGKSLAEELPSQEIENYNFEEKEKIIERYKPRSSTPITVNLGDIKDSDYIDYDDTIINELYIWLNKQPKGIVGSILSKLNEIMSKYGFEDIARLIDTFQDKLPDLNSKVYYSNDLKPLYEFLIWCDSFLSDKKESFSLEENKEITSALEKEENFQ